MSMILSSRRMRLPKLLRMNLRSGYLWIFLVFFLFLNINGVGRSMGLEQQRRRMHPTTNEPLFTNCTKDFIGTHDYIFYSANSLTVESLLELLDEDCLRKDTALPSPEWSSDHIALLAEFRCKSRARRC